LGGQQSNRTGDDLRGSARITMRTGEASISTEAVIFSGFLRYRGGALRGGLATDIVRRASGVPDTMAIELADDEIFATAEDGQPLATVSRYQELISTLVKRKEALKFTHDELDEASHLSAGYSSKIFMGTHIRTLSGESFGRLLKTLGLRLIVIADKVPQRPLRPKNANQDRGQARVIPPRQCGSAANGL
jgi:hypothetical protein